MENKTQNNSRQNWLEARKKGLGGSEIASILGLNPYSSALDVFLDKTGQTPPIEDNKYMKAGRKLEPIIVDYFAEETGLKPIEGFEEDVIIKHKDFDFLLGTPDRFILDQDGKVYVLECKSTQKEISSDNLPEAWFCQLQWYLGISGKEKGFIAWLSRGVDFGFTEVDFVPEFFDFMVDKAVSFWQNNVLTGTPPEPQNGDEVQKLYKSHVDGKIIESSDDLNKLIINLKDLREIISEYETKESEIINQIKLILKDAEGIKKDGNLLITWKAGKSTESFNQAAFKKNYPEIWQMYSEQKPGARRFLIK